MSVKQVNRGESPQDPRRVQFHPQTEFKKRGKSLSDLRPFLREIVVDESFFRGRRVVPFNLPKINFEGLKSLKKDYPEDRLAHIEDGAISSKRLIEELNRCIENRFNPPLVLIQLLIESLAGMKQIQPLRKLYSALPDHLLSAATCLSIYRLYMANELWKDAFDVYLNHKSFIDRFLTDSEKEKIVVKVGPFTRESSERLRTELFV